LNKYKNDNIIINYNQKNFICEKHNETFIKYCNDCKINICKSCSNEHNSHKIIYYCNIILDMKEIKKNKRINRNI